MNWYDIQNTDCISAMHKVKSDSVDLILTDPPYNLGLFMKSRETNLKQMRSNFFGSAGWDNLEFEEWIESMDDFFAEAARTVKVGGSLIMFMSLIKIETIIKLAEKHGFYYKTTGIWHKLNPMPRNMNLHFINSTEAWLYFVYKKHTGTFNNDGKAIHDFFETSVTPTGERKFAICSTAFKRKRYCHGSVHGKWKFGRSCTYLKAQFYRFGNQRRLLPDKQRTTFITWGAKK